MDQDLTQYIPQEAIAYVNKLLVSDRLKVLVKPKRSTKHGDYRMLPNNYHQITINGSLNQYKFLMTLIHEVAHYEAFKRYGRAIKPHGKEWKHTFQHLMLPLIRPEVFPKELLPYLAKHFINPKATSDSDKYLNYAFRQYDPPTDKIAVFELEIGQEFRLENGRVFKKGRTRRTRIECLELSKDKLYLFNPNVEVELLKDSNNNQL